MATIQHSALTTTDLHEPKGADAALADEVYVADGSGSGEWKKIYTHGWEDYNDSGTSQSLTSGSWVDLTNDGAGANTSTTYRIPGGTAVWDTTNNQFDFSFLNIGDQVDLRVDLEVTTAGANNEVAVRLDIAHGDAAEFPLEFHRTSFKAAGTYQILRSFPIYIGSAEVRDNPAKIAMTTDAAGNSVVVKGWLVTVWPRNPVLS